ncbi:sugar diacid recognition domain-containing protein [Pseudovibrio sp. SPO723]|uniref:sugar diacid recognition domain-containing protein n=1 Tax=Nesiotobacter zosterae TaxID=392721 RepID=UPI0029C1BE24|nr:sugar diacid recognition domain-containing protein [Pseudovibrio sp. SPO723]MDX5592133.1 sugar diacid recognition domain-containing protein [Pseudovibrio sp. SPO723]
MLGEVKHVPFGERGLDKAAHSEKTQINSSIARQIVERAMKIIPFSVNVMDGNGLIIGSGDPSRLHQRHEGALLAINDNRTVDIDAATAQHLTGVRPGVNIPILFQEAPIGVVGISGPPEQVRRYAELVKMAAELIIEQASLLNHVEWDKRHREELVLQLVQGPDLHEMHLRTIAERLGIDLSQPRIASIVRVLPAPGQELSLDHLQRLVHLLEFPERNNLVGISSVARNEVIVLKPITLNRTGWSQELERERVAKLMERVRRETDFEIRIALGGFFQGLSGLSRSYETAKATLEAVSDADAHNAGHMLFYHDHTLAVLINGLSGRNWRGAELCRPLRALEGKDVLLETLACFFRNNEDHISVCAELGIHRNSLRYRLKRIEEETGLNLYNIGDKTRLYLAMLHQG